MKYLVKKEVKVVVRHLDPSSNETVVEVQSKTLYVQDTHTFNLKGRRLVTLTDLENYAQEFSLDEAMTFLKENKKFIIEEVEEEYDNMSIKGEDYE